MRTFIGIVLVSLSLSTAALAAPPDAWGKLCAKCHGEDGKAKTKMGERLKIGDMTTAEWQGARTDDKMKASIAEGNAEKKMPKFGDKVSADDVAALVKFVRSLKP